MKKLNQSDGGKKIFRSYVRRSSLDMLFKFKNNSGQERQESQRKSCISFDKIKSARNQDPSQGKLQKQSDNIYFNPKSRAKFFKNLIDAYFIKNQQNPNNIKQSNNKSPSKSSYLCRKSLSNRKSQHVQRSLNLANDFSVNKQESCYQKNAKSQIYELNSSKFEAYSQKKRQNDKNKVSLRYKQQHRGHLSVEKQQGSSTQQPDNNSVQVKVEQSSNQAKDPCYLPRITQAIDDDIDNQHRHGQSSKLQFVQTADSFKKESSYSFSQRNNKKNILFEISICRIYKSIEGSQRLIIKQFRDYIFIERHNKALSHGATSIWQEYRFDVLSLYTNYKYSLRDCLYKIYPNSVNNHSLILQPTPFHSKLVTNHCQQLYILFRQLILQLSQIQNKLINNKITLSNLYLAKDGSRLIIGDWQHSSFRGQCQIREGLFQSRTQPILRCEEEWLLEPEYLATEILESMVDVKEEFDLWQGGSNVSDVYSLGLVFLEIVTLVPLTVGKSVSIKTKTTFKPREGYLSTANKSLTKIIQCQKALVRKMSIALQRQIDQAEKNEKFFSLILRMIEPIRQKRITFDELLNQIHR